MSALDEEQLRRLIEVGREIVAELDLDAVLERVLEVACGITGARYAALGVLDERREELARFITRGVDEQTRRAIGSLPRGLGVLGALIHDPRALRLPDVGAHPESWGFPPGHPPMETFLGVPILVGGKAFGNIYLSDKRGGEEFNEADEEAMLVLADWAAVAVRNAQSHRVVRGRRDELERAVRGLEAMTEIARAVGAETRLDRILELIVKRGRALVHARAMAVLVQEGDEVVVTAIAGDLDPDVMGLRMPLGESVSGDVIRLGRPVRLGDEASTLRSGLATSLGAEAGLYVPLVYQGRVLGVLNAFDRVEEGPAFSNDDERLMQSFAASAAVAIASAQNAAALGLRRSLEATERERGRWARELHDETLQDLAALAIRLSAVRERATVEEMRREIDQAVAQAGAAAQTLRGLITDLRPAALDQLGLEPAVEALVERVGASTGLSVELDSDLTANGRVSHRLDAETESAAYRLVQEALTNVMKHAAAEHAAVTLTDTGETVVVTVQDDGRGFAPDDASQGFGLIGMRERVSLLGGTVEVRSELGTGTTVEATLPAARGSAALADERVAAERRP